MSGLRARGWSREPSAENQHGFETDDTRRADGSPNWRDRTMQARVTRRPDLAHPAFTAAIDNLVRTSLRSDLRRSGKSPILRLQARAYPKHRTRLVPGELHRDALGAASPPEAADGGPTEVVGNAPRTACGHAGLPPRFVEALSRWRTTSELRHNLSCPQRLPTAISWAGQTVFRQLDNAPYRANRGTRERQLSVPRSMTSIIPAGNRELI